MIMFEGIAEHLLHGQSAGGCGLMFLQNVAQLPFNSACGEFQIMHTEQHGLL